jgi:thiamine-monophosphate kinase
MIDVSDGLLQDLGHLCQSSGVGAVIWKEKIPLSPAYRTLAGREGTRYALFGGEDYELLFCARPRARPRIQKLQKRAKVAMSRIGTCVSACEGITVVDGQGNRMSTHAHGHDHFKH